MSASSVSTGGGAPAPSSAWRAALAALMRSAGLAGLVQQRGDVGSAGFVDREDDAAYVGLRRVKAAPLAGLGRSIEDLREGAGDGLVTDGYRQPGDCSSLSHGETVAR
jgi:hypothetical protein